MLKKQSSDPNELSSVFVASEGFLDHRYLPFIRTHDVSIIEIRALADGPMMHTIHLHPDKKSKHHP